MTKTGKPILDGIGATEMLHIFQSPTGSTTCTRQPTGRPVTGYEAKIVDDDMREVAIGEIGRLAVRGPTGCRYLAERPPERSTSGDGWNMTGDSFYQDEERSLPLCRQVRRHDRLGRLQHCRSRGGSRAAFA